MNLAMNNRGSRDYRTVSRIIPTNLTLSMTVLGVLLICCLIAAPVQAGRHTITSLPYTFSANQRTSDQWDTLVISGTSLTSSGNGITMQSVYGNRLHNILLLLEGDTLIYGSGGGRATGLQITGTSSYHSNNIIVKGGYILHHANGANSDGSRAMVLEGHDITIENVTATVRGDNGIVLWSGGFYQWNNIIRGGTFTSYTTGFTSRCQYDAPVVKFYDCYTSSLADSGGAYHWEVDGLTIANGPHMGIAALGRESSGNYAKVKIHDCTITTDAINDFYSSYSGTCMSSANPYGISVRHCQAGTEIYNNTIISGTARGGNRGIIIEYANGNATDSVKIYGNVMNLWEGPNVEYGEGLPVHGIRIRYQPRYVHCYGNIIECTADNLSSTSHIGSQAHAIRYSYNIENTHNCFEGNTLYARALTGGVTCIGIVVEGDDTPSPAMDTTCIFRNNKINSSGACIWIGYDNGGAHNVRFMGDTLAFLSPTVSPETFHVGLYGNNWDCSNNKVCDMVYRDGTSDDDINLASGGTLELGVQRTINVTVRGANSLPVPGASVTVTNNYGQTVLSGTTGAGGTLAGPVTYRWSSRSSDSSSYNNFTLKAWKAGDSSSTVFNVGASTANPTVTLQTVGTPDTIPPDPVIDLGAVGGGDDGTIILTWTAPGEDGDEGLAASYDIRHSLNPINDGNWNSASQVGSEPTPTIAGSTQSLTLTGLTPGAWYYIGMKTIDNHDNPSDLSNIAQAEARLNFITGDDDVLVTLTAPRNDSSVNTSHPSLIVLNTNGQAGNMYFFEVAADSSFVNLAAASDAVPQESGTTTAWIVGTKLTTGQRYYWRVRLNDNPYSNVLSFLVDPETHAYPNPYLMSAGVPVTFTEIPSGANLVLMTVSGDVVRRWQNLNGEDIQWDGNNDSGNRVASGTYLWYIEDSDAKGKLVVVR